MAQLKEAPVASGFRKGIGARDYRRPKSVRSALIRLMSYLGHSKLLLPLVLILMLLGTVLTLCASYLLKPIIDDCILPNVASASQNWQPLVNNLILLAALYALVLISSYGQSALMMVISHKSINHLRRDLFNHLQDASISYFDKHTHGELMSRFTNDADNVQVAIEQAFTSFISSIITLVGTIYLMLLLNWKLFIITAAFVLLAIILSRLMSSKSRALFSEQQKNLGCLNAYIEEMITGIKAVKAFGYEDSAGREFTSLNANFRDASTKANFLGMSLMPMINHVMGICYAFTAIAGAFFVMNGSQLGTAAFTVGSLGVFLTYTKQVRMPINQITNQFVTLMSALAGAERIFEAMDRPPEADDGNVELAATGYGPEWVFKGKSLASACGNIELQNVSFFYSEDNTAPTIDNLSLKVLSGQKIAFVGSTGAGKTTIANLLTRFYEIQGGKILYDGIDIKQIKKSSLRSCVAVVLQDTHLFTGTVMENIRYGNLAASDDECVNAAQAANAHEFILNLPNGYKTVITSDGDALSQGQRQLLNIARAILSNRPVLILDEATSSVDTRTERLIDSAMSRLIKGKTLFIIAHRLSTVRNADKIAVIENGAILELGSHEELLSLKKRYYELYTGQHSLK